jgi:hypothetical protein
VGSKAYRQLAFARCLGAPCGSHDRHALVKVARDAMVRSHIAQLRHLEPEPLLGVETTRMEPAPGGGENALGTSPVKMMRW